MSNRAVKGILYPDGEGGLIGGFLTKKPYDFPAGYNMLVRNTAGLSDGSFGNVEIEIVDEPIVPNVQAFVLRIQSASNDAHAAEDLVRDIFQGDKVTVKSSSTPPPALADIWVAIIT